MTVPMLPDLRLRAIQIDPRFIQYHFQNRVRLDIAIGSGPEIDSRATT
jgi:hypothetical protein